MKKNAAIAFLLLFATLSYFVISCQHQVRCEDVGFQINTNHTNSSFNQNDGSITVTATGGNNFQYSLNNGAFDTLSSFNNLAAGTYVVHGKNSLGCTDEDTVVISSAADPCAGVNISVQAVATDATQGLSNGTITAIASGGGNSYTYSIDGVNFQALGTFTNLPAGSYTVTAENPTGCSGSTQVTVNTVNPCTGVTINLTETHTDPIVGQNNGSITVTASPAGTYTYSINGGIFQSSNTFSNLATGTYTIIAQNSNGCSSAPLSVTLGLINPCTGVNITVSTTITSPTIGQSNGSITVTAAPTGTYTYSINGGTYQSSNVFTGLAAGTYNVTAKNANNCTGSAQVILVATNPCLGVSINVTNSPSNPTNGANGSITASASGGVAPYTYSLNGGTYQSSATFSNLSSGAYTITAKDANGCTSAATASTLACPHVSATGTPTSSRANCANNSISIVAANGLAPYTYSINGTTFQTSATITPLAGGTYTITVKDSKGCTATSSVTINAPATVHFATDVKPTINATCGRSNVSCHSHNNSWTTYSDIVGTSTGDNWSSNLLTFIKRVRGTSTSTNCVYSSGLHDMPPTNTTAWTTFIQGVFTNWVNQGYPNN